MRRPVLAASVVALCLCSPTAVAQDTGAADGATNIRGTGGTAPEQADGEPAKRLRVALAGSAPFVVTENGKPTGIAVQIWDEVATRLDWEFEYVEYEGVGEALDALTDGQADVAVGNISITADRAREVHFSHPYHEASLSILAPTSQGAAWDRIKPFLSRAFLVGVGGLLLILAMVGVLFWLSERRHNPEHFPKNPIRGIGNGIWLALVTMTTVGYGDRAPISITGRIVAGVWMVIAMLTASSLTASIATALTLSQLDRGTISKADQLANKRIAVIEGTQSANFARGHGARLVFVADVEAGVESIRDDEADAIVFDRPILRYYLYRHPETELTLSDARYQSRGYGFALPLDNTVTHELDVALLEIEEDGRIEKIRDGWLSES